MTLSVRLAVPFMLLALSAMPAGALAAPKLTNSSFRGDVAEAAFFVTDGCNGSVVGISASDGSSNDRATGRQRGASVRVNVVSFDICIGSTLHEISADVELVAGQFSVDSGLAMAALQASVPGYDQITGQPTVLDLRVTWTATSAASMTRSIEMVTLPDGTRELTRADGQQREATATGTVSGNGFVFVAGTAALADVQSVRDGSLLRSSR